MDKFKIGDVVTYVPPIATRLGAGPYRIIGKQHSLYKMQHLDGSRLKKEESAYWSEEGYSYLATESELIECVFLTAALKAVAEAKDGAS